MQSSQHKAKNSLRNLTQNSKQGLKQTPLVSIIVPIYNVASYLKECLQSIVEQSYENLDIILIDDGSDDESLKIALNFAESDERIFVVSKPNGGQATARNFGLEFIKGSALRTFFDDGDFSPTAQNDNNQLCHTDKSCHNETFSCHTERSEVSQIQNRDISLSMKAQYDKEYNTNSLSCYTGLLLESEVSQCNTISLTQNQITYSKYPAFVYIITNKTHTTLYIGVTSNLQKRIYEHKNHLTKGFSDKYNCEKLVYFESFDNIEQAIEKEKYLKGKKRNFKENLINSINPQWLDLYEYLFGDISHSLNMTNDSKEIFRYAQNDKVKASQNDKNQACHNETFSCHTERSEVSQIQNRDISFSTKAQYDKEKAFQTNTSIQSLSQTHSFEKSYKSIDTQELRAHFTQIKHNFIKSDLERINDFITQELPQNALIHFVDSDDYITQDCVAKCVQTLLEKDLDIVVHNIKHFYEENKSFKQGEFLSNLHQNAYESGLKLLKENRLYSFYFSVQGLFKASILNRYALRFTEGIYHEDHDFGTLLFCLAGKISYTNEPLYIYRQRANSTMSGQKNSSMPAKLPSFLEPLRADFKDYKALRAYFKSFCFVLVGFNIWEFFRQKSEQNAKFRQEFRDFFEKTALAYMKIFKSPLKPDTMGIKELLQKMNFSKSLVWREFFKDLHRQPKKIRFIAHIKYLLTKDTQ